MNKKYIFSIIFIATSIIIFLLLFTKYFGNTRIIDKELITEGPYSIQRIKEQTDAINVYTRQGFEFTVKQNQIRQCTGNSKIFVYKIHRDVVGLDVFGKLRIFLVNKFGSTAYIATEYKITN